MSGDQFIGLTYTVEIEGRAFSIEGPGAPDDLTRAAEARGESDPAYWAHLWPIAESFARHVATTDWITPTTRVLEIGAGLGLVGLVAASRCAHAVITDVNADAVATARRNAACNRIKNVTLAPFDYTTAPDASWLPDLLLASDVLYHRASHAPIGTLIRDLGVPAMIADPNRPQADDLESTFESLGLRTWQTPIDGGRVFIVQG